jgi:biopolymer transport protein ExbD
MNTDSQRPKQAKRQFAAIHPSLVDVMCCLVILYLLTSLLAATSSQEAREKTLPSVNLAGLTDHGSPATDSRAQGVVVSVQPGPAYYLDERPVPLAAMAAEFSKSRPPEVEVRGDEAVPYGTVMNVMRICREAGISRVALTYKIQEEKNHGN